MIGFRTQTQTHIHAALLLCATLVLGGCANANPYFNATKSHHTPEGFRNNGTDGVVRPFSDLLRWKWAAIRDDLPPPPKIPTPVQAPDLALINANARAGIAMQPMVTWIGHATALVQASGLNVLTDPIFSERAFPVQIAGPKRTQPPGVALADLPPIDVVIVSHNHYDHLDRLSVIALNERANGSTMFLVPLGNKPWMENVGITNVIELDWWDSATLTRNKDGKPARAAPGQAGVEFYLTPVQHWSARGMGDRSATLWGGWSVFGPDFQWYFGGDNGYSQDFVDTFKKFPNRRLPGDATKLFDLALVPIGAYEPRWFMKEQHVNPMEAVQTHKDLGAVQSIGIHWGTFNLTDEALDQPPIDLIAARKAMGMAEADFYLLKIGETRRILRR
jgi:N-acyl-phosphatidylethanolamine-hydrolysing phospholipase D